MSKMSPTPFEVTWLYRALLGRDPGSKTILTEACTEPSIHALRRRILRSEEFRMRLSGASTNNGTWAFESEPELIADLTWHSPLSERQIQLAFLAVLQRDANRVELADRLIKQIDLFGLVDELLNSKERKDAEERRVLLERFGRRLHEPSKRLHRILLFGAYNNGNVGDACQVASLASLLKKFGIGTDTAELSACSWESVLFAEADTTVVVPGDEIINADRLIDYDFILIGGGGLLSTPHFPLFEEKWTAGLANLGVPYGIFGVGASMEEVSHPSRREAYTSLIKNAAFVIARDEPSLEALRSVRADARLAQDPFLMAYAGAFAKNWKTNTRNKRHKNVIFIPKAPVDEIEIAALSQMASLAEYFKGLGVPIATLLFERAIDIDIASKFENVTYVDNAEDAVALIGKASDVYTMRYHGAIIALLNGVSCWALGVPKLLQLYSEMSIEKFFVKGTAECDEMAVPFEENDWLMVQDFLKNSERGVGSLEDIVRLIATSLERRETSG